MSWFLKRLRELLRRIQCLFATIIRLVLGRPPSVTCWLYRHPKVAWQIRWQFTFESSAYDIPESAKRPWIDWTAAEKNELQAAFDAAWTWFESQSGIYTPAGETLVHPPPNQKDTSNDNGSPWTSVTGTYARDLYIQWIALQLAVEIGNRVPWSVTTYNAEKLQVLFDSAAIMSRLADGSYNVATGSPGHPNYVKRKDNLGASLIAPPRYTYSFLVNSGIIGATRLATIGKLLDWVSANCVHYFGASTYQNMEDHWQYRGCPPIGRTIEGTTNPNIGSGSFNHWTAGCHGTTGLLRNVLRAVNIPAAITTVCGHSQAVFLTEGRYLDHGDNPYNSTFTGTGLPAVDLLIDQATYESWFGTSTDNRSEGCDKIGHQVDVLAGS
jgi:hypothetical protein